MILITGSAGFIGSNLCFYLVNNLQAEVIGIDKLGIGSNRNWTYTLETGPNRMIFKKIDLCNIDSINELFKNYPIDTIIHLAAETHVDRSINDPSEFWKSNVQGTFNLMNIAHLYEIDFFINQITDEVYGEKLTGEAFEDDKLNPTSPYAYSKASQYFVGKSFAKTFDLPIISTFPVNCFGPRQYYEKLIPKFIYKLMKNEKVPLMKSVYFQRDWLPVEDMCKAIVFLLEKGNAGADYNIGANNHITNMQLTKLLLQFCAKDESYIEIVEDRKSHDCRYAVNCDKIKSLGFSHSRKFDEYLEETVSWYKDYYNAYSV